MRIARGRAAYTGRGAVLTRLDDAVNVVSLSSKSVSQDEPPQLTDQSFLHLPRMLKQHAGLFFRGRAKCDAIDVRFSGGSPRTRADHRFVVQIVPLTSAVPYFGRPARCAATVLLKLLPLLASQFVDQSIAPRNDGYLATGR
jgi:hypothetical protein